MVTYKTPPNQSKGILDDFAVRKNVATREGTIEKVPVNNSDIVNKKFVDDDFVPYTGAAKTVDLGVEELKAGRFNNVSGTYTSPSSSSLHTLGSGEGTFLIDFMTFQQFRPTADDYFTLGNSSLNWKELYLKKTEGSVLFSGADGIVEEDNFNLFWNAATNELQPNLLKITSDGTQAAPALKFNDTNTGFFKVGDSIRLSLNNSTKMIIDSTGLGIGTNAPTNDVTLSRPSSKAVFKALFNSNQWFSFNANDETNFMGSFTVYGANEATRANQVEFRAAADGAGYFTFKTRDGGAVDRTRMAILNNGKVGIGTISPQAGFHNVGDTRLGDQAANYVEIGAAGDQVFVGGAGLTYGFIEGDHIAFVRASVVQNTWYNIADPDIVDGFLHNTTHNGSGIMTVTKAGHYWVAFNVSWEVTAANVHTEFGIEVNSSGSANATGPHIHTTSKFANQEQDNSSGAIMDLNANDTIEIALRTIDAGAPNFTVDNVHLTCYQIGGT